MAEKILVRRQLTPHEKDSVRAYAAMFGSSLGRLIGSDLMSPTLQLMQLVIDTGNENVEAGHEDATPESKHHVEIQAELILQQEFPMAVK